VLEGLMRERRLVGGELDFRVGDLLREYEMNSPE
jgi:hypothetical protein